jgi:large subunit ribosomal protein L15
LEAFVEKTNITVIDVEILINAGLAPKNSLVKILGNGALTKKIDVKAHAFSNSAKTAIETLEGTVSVLRQAVGEPVETAQQP